MQYSLNYSGTRFLSTEIKITQFPGGFRLNSLNSEIQNASSTALFNSELKYILKRVLSLSAYLGPGTEGLSYRHKPFSY